MGVLSKLKEVRELLTDPKHFTQNEMARNEYDEPTYPNAENAMCWCLEGAICKVYGAEYLNNFDGSNSLWNYLRDVLIHSFPRNHVNGVLWRYNDFRGYEAVLKLLDKAIEDYPV